MGYDMRIEHTPEPEATKVAETEAAFYAAVKERDALSDRDPAQRAAQAKVNAAYEATREADAGYFRINIWGMSRYRELMEQLGMVVSGYERPGWPDEPEGVSWDDIEAAQEGKPSASPDAVAFVKATEAVVAWHPEPAFGIALHKFGSNDGWLVTPEEIAAALESYRTHSGDEVKVIVGDDGLDYWLKWIAYLERAQQRGGFRVH